MSTEQVPLKYNKQESLEGWDGSILTPTSKLVYKQWQMDDDKNLLIDGYFRQQSNIKSFQLPHDLKQIIKSYYMPMYSKNKLVELILRRQNSIRRVKQLRKQNVKDNCYNFSLILCYIFGFIFSLLWLFGPDIAGLIIYAKNDCNLSIDDQSVSVEIEVNEFLLIGCVSHMVCTFVATIVMWALMSNANCDWEKFVHLIVGSVVIVRICMILFFIAWSIVGFLLYRKMDTSNQSNKQCANMVLSWSVLKLIECFIPAPLFLGTWFVMMYVSVED
eukprot:384894_1